MGMTKRDKLVLAAASGACVLLIGTFSWAYWRANEELTKYESGHAQLIDHLGELAVSLMGSEGTLPVHIENIIPEWKAKYANLIDGDIVALEIYTIQPHPGFAFEVIGNIRSWEGSYGPSVEYPDGRSFARGDVDVDGRMYHVNEYGIVHKVDGRQFRFLIDVSYK